MKNIIIRTVGVFSLLSFLLFSVGACNVRPQKYSRSYLKYFDTVTSFTYYAKNEEKANEISAFLEQELDRAHKLFDIYNDYENITNIKTLNDSASISPIVVDPLLFELVEYSISAYDLSSGYINIAMGSVLKLWHEARSNAYTSPESASLPKIDDLLSASEHCDIDDVILDKEKHTIFFKDPSLSLDVGATAKGFTVQKISKALKEKGVENFVLNVGGNVFASGNKEKNAMWNIGIEDPSNPSNILLDMNISNKALVTSGSYQRYFTIDDIRYHHIIDPHTLMPCDNFLSVSVICDDSALADVLSTALFCMPLDEGMTLVESMIDVEAMWIFKNGEQRYSKSFGDYITDH